MMEGWISLHRKILENPILNRSRTYSNFEAWIWLLIKANHKDNKFLLGTDLINVKKGDIVTSEKKLCKRFRWSNSKLRNFLKLLEKDQMITLETTSKATYISICNYGTYQESQIAKKSQKNRKSIANKSEKNTNNNSNNVNNVNNVNKKITLQDFQDLLKDEKCLKKYGHRMLKEFVEYWIEPSINGKKYRWQMEKAFKISKRLSTWATQDYKGTFKIHKEEMINKEKDEYYRRNAEKVSREESERQKKEMNKITSGMFKKV